MIIKIIRERIPFYDFMCCAMQETFEESEYAHIKIIRHIYKIIDRILSLNLM